MSDFPPGFDFESLITDEDRELRELAQNLYSRSGVDHIRDKYMVPEEDWTDYKRKVIELLERKLLEEEFIKAMKRLNSKLLPVFY